MKSSEVEVEVKEEEEEEAEGEKEERKGETSGACARLEGVRHGSADSARY